MRLNSGEDDGDALMGSGGELDQLVVFIVMCELRVERSPVAWHCPRATQVHTGRATSYDTSLHPHVLLTISSLSHSSPSPIPDPPNPMTFKSSSNNSALSTALSTLRLLSRVCCASAELRETARWWAGRGGVDMVRGGKNESACLAAYG